MELLGISANFSFTDKYQKNSYVVPNIYNKIKVSKSKKIELKNLLLLGSQASVASALITENFPVLLLKYGDPNEIELKTGGYGLWTFNNPEPWNQILVSDAYDDILKIACYSC